MVVVYCGVQYQIYGDHFLQGVGIECSGGGGGSGQPNIQTWTDT